LKLRVKATQKTLTSNTILNFRLRTKYWENYKKSHFSYFKIYFTL